ncbi:magnesium chelatase subunit H [Roseospirillum parvum]|uniref:magnesium chelatase n=1 Tax=Roseospirillum parvum TaxID=83401 RepID=A0A1G7WCY4_9PROT|nr:magnesium chelatase subunit H [Roseospirillum parvum]SDG69649.1 magnesium chelatase subunit H [Roseospirillum parvum]
MTQKHTSAIKGDLAATPVKVVIITLDGHLSGAVARARQALKADLPGLTLALHCAVEWADDPEAAQRCRDDIAEADVIIATMLFLEDQIQAVLPALEARRAECDAIVGCLAASEVVKLTRLGGFDMAAPQGSLMTLLKKLRGESAGKDGGGAGAQQMAMLRRLPRILRLVPGKAQDVRAYFLTLQYWLAGSDENIANMVRFLVGRYSSGDRAALKGAVKAAPAIEYPEVGLYHPTLPGRVSENVADLPAPKGEVKGTVGLLVMRSYVLAGNTAHYDGVIRAMEAKGLKVVPAYASGLDSRPAVEAFFRQDGRTVVDAVVSLTGFSMVGGPAYNDSRAAEDMLAELDVPYLTTHAVEFQTLDQWAESELGLLPVEATMMVAIPELDGAIAPMTFGGRTDTVEGGDEGGGATASGPEATSRNPTKGRGAGEMRANPERAQALAARVARLVRLRRTPARERRVAIILFNFPPNAGATGTAAYLGVYASLLDTLKAMKAEGYQVEVPESEEALRKAILEGNAALYGTPANVHARVSADDHVKGESWLAEIEAQWGPAPGRELTDGADLFILGAGFGNVFVGIQPNFGWEGDPMRLLFERGFAPTHAFSAFYRWLSRDYDAHAVVHYGTHGALEFMPGKQVGLSDRCWPERLIGDLPNIYLYAANNPSEGTLAKRRSAATLITYLTPPITHAGLHSGLLDLKDSMDRWRALPPDAEDERVRLAELIQTQAADIDLCPAEPCWKPDEQAAEVEALRTRLIELEDTLIPFGLHTFGSAPSAEARVDLLAAVAEATHGATPARELLESLVHDGAGAQSVIARAGVADDADAVAMFEELATIARLMADNQEMAGLLKALDGRYIRPAPGGDLLRTPAILPTGRNMHGFDPFRLPTLFAVEDGARQAELLIETHREAGNGYPSSIAMVLWGTDNLKNGGGPIGQALSLMGAKPRFDGYGRLAGADLVPLEKLGRPRIDVVMTLSGIFRDLLPLQTRLLAEAAYLAASADEPPEQNFVRKHTLDYMERQGVDFETAALRVFSNADGAYGSNVNQLVDSGRWENEDELAEVYSRRKSFAYGRSGKPTQQTELLQTALGDVDMAYQNLESVELGVTTVDHYFDTLGGISRAVSRAKGGAVPVYIGDQTKGSGKVRTLAEQVALETRTRVLNPKWYEGMLASGYEGVRQIEAHVTNTMGWSATTGQVAPWVYKQLTQTFLLDPEMRKRMAELNPMASARVANRLLEAHERNYWTPDDDMLQALREAGEELEDRLEGVTDSEEGVAA